MSDSDIHPAVLCAFGDDRLTLAAPHAGTGPETVQKGSLADVRRALGNGPLNGVRLEAAIACTEDLIMPMLARLPAATTLLISDRHMDRLRSLLPATAAHPVMIDAVEHLFNALADRAQGSVTSWHHDVDADDVAMGLVVLRELMHHGRFSAFAWTDATPSPGP